MSQSSKDVDALIEREDRYAKAMRLGPHAVMAVADAEIQGAQARALREAALAYNAARTAQPSSVQYLRAETFLCDRAAEIEAGW